MAIKAIWQALTHQEVAVETPFTSKRMQRVWWALNSLYEATASVVARGGSTQNIFGHNHSGEGGGCFVRGGLTIVDRGDEPAHEFLPTQKSELMVLAGSIGTSVGGEYFVSPNISGPVRVRLVYSSKNSKFTLRLKESRSIGLVLQKTELELEQTYEKSEDEVFAVVEFDVQAAGGVRNAHHLTVQNDDYDPNDEPVFRIWHWHVFEDAARTNPPQHFDLREVK